MDRMLRLVIVGLFTSLLYCQAQQPDLDRLRNLFTYQFQQQRYSLALQTATQAVTVAKSTLSGDDQRLADVMEDLATASAQKSRYEQAANLYRQALEIRRQHPGASASALIRCTQSLGNVYYWAGSYDEARPYYSDAVRMSLADAPGGEGLARSLNALAEVEYEEGNYAEAEHLLQHAVSAYVDACGYGDPLYRGAELRLASIYLADRKVDEATATYRRVIGKLEAHLGELHPSLTPALTGLARVEAQRGNALEAGDLYARVAEIDRVTYGDTSAAFAMDLATLADHYADAGQYATAEPLAERAVKIWEGMPKADPMNTARALDRLAGIYTRNGEVIGAESAYKRAIELAQASRDGSYTIQYMRNLATMYTDAGNLVAARETLEQAMETAATQTAGSRRLTSFDRESLRDQYATVMITLHGTTDYAGAQDTPEGTR